MAQVGSEGIEEKLKRRTKQFAIEIIRLVQSLNRNLVADVLARQLLRSGTSVGANYRSACRARSKADMLSKLAIAEEEADECLYWIDLLVEAGELNTAVAKPVSDECEQILRMLVASIKTLRAGPQAHSYVKEQLATYRAERDEDRVDTLKVLSENGVLKG